MSAVLQAERQTALGETSSSEGQQQRRWKNPNEVVRIRRKLSRKPSLKYIPGQRSESLREDTTKRTTPVLKRTTLKRTSENLTASTPPKRPRGGLQDISNSPVAPPRTPDKKNLAPQDPHKDRDCITTEYPPPTLSSPSDTVAALPLDWALKTKVRFVSPFPFTWTQSLRPQQEASGLTNFLTGSGDQIHHKASCDRQEELQERLMLWVHPSLPFLKVFPRNSSASDTRQKIPHYTALLQDEQVLQALRDDWSTSMCSVYQLLKCGHCPFFYLCANQFTVLFASSGVRGSPSISAVITPTTSGMRETLKKEGAELSLPLAPNKGVVGEDEVYSDAEEDGGATDWLANMGLPAQDLPRLRTQRSTLPRESRIDNRPESVVLVEGPGSVHVLFNYLLTSKTTISTTGSHAGLPPTILSPLGFRGATLRSLKVNLARQNC
jgi:hypothetical protein